MSTTEPNRDAVTILKEHGIAVTAYLTGLRGRYPGGPPRLLDAVDYSLLAGGKRLRPALVLECARAAEDQFIPPPGRETLDVPHGSHMARRPRRDSALAAAAAVELVHTFSLVHDDLPAMDDDDLRRGRPTNHKVFGEAMAILAGDAMVAAAFEVLAANAAPNVVPALVGELARATGPEGMIGGQVLDMEGEHAALSLEQLQRVHRLKTGALLTASCRMGAIAAEVREGPILNAVTDYGRHLGLAFQIVDDVLDVTGTPEQLGKATGKDAGRGKNTYPALIGLEASRQQAQQQLELAIRALNPLGESAEGLRKLARFVAERQS